MGNVIELKSKFIFKTLSQEEKKRRNPMIESPVSYIRGIIPASDSLIDLGAILLGKAKDECNVSTRAEHLQAALNAIEGALILACAADDIKSGELRHESER